MDIRKHWMRLPEGGALMGAWFVVAVLLALAANVLAAFWVMSH